MENKGKFENGIIGYLINNSVAANLLTIVLIFGGFLSLMGLKSEVFPTISPRTVNVTVPFPGATPIEVEEGITSRLEGAVMGLEGVKRVRSVASENSGSLTIELSDFADRQKVKDDVESAIGRLSSFPPENAEKPTIIAPEATGGVVSLVLKGNLSSLDLRKAAEIVENDMMSFPGISLINLVGDQDYEISIEIKEETLREYGLTFQEISNAIKASSVSQSGGEIYAESGSVLLRVDEKKYKGTEFESVVIRNEENGSKVLLKDVAEIRDGFSREKVINTYNGEPAIFIQVSRSSSEDVLKIKNDVELFLENYNPPQGVELSLFKDQSLILEERFDLLSKNAIFGFALVLTFMVLMLDLKLAVWVCVGIATAFMGGFILFGALDVTLTMVSLFGLIIVLGLVVDDAVVIGENIDNYRAKGYDDKTAAVKGVKGIMAPVLVGVLTTIAAFSPLLFTGGTFGDISRAIPLVVISVLVVSLFEAFFILPSHLSSAGNWSKGALKTIQTFIANKIYAFAQNLVYPLVKKAVEWRYLTFGITIAFFMFSINLVSKGNVPFVFFPQIEGNEISVTVDFPKGTRFEKTETAVLKLEEGILQVADDLKTKDGQEVLKSISLTIGGRSSRGGGPVATNSFSAQSHIGQVQVELTAYGSRTISAKDISNLWREEVGQIEGVEKLKYNSTIADFGSDVQFDLFHREDEKLAEAVLELKNKLGSMEGVYQIEDSYDYGKKQMVFSLNDTGLAAGLSVKDISTQIRQAFFGDEVQRIQRGREEIKVFVRFPEDARANMGTLSNFRIRLPNGEGVPLSTVADLTESRAFSSISRIDGRRVVEISANVNEQILTPNAANNEVESFLPILAERIPGLKWEKSGAGREQNEDFSSLASAFLLVLVVIYSIVAAQLRSYIQPLAILISIPLGLAGAILGHYVLGYALSFVSMFGIVALAGVAVNSSVILLDYYNKQRLKGVDVIEAAANASVRRFRPILITTLTTAFGLLPLLFEPSPQAQFLIPMAVSLGFGIIISGLFILVVTPALSVIIEDLRMEKSSKMPFVKLETSPPKP